MSALTVELVTMPVVCCECKRHYKDIPGGQTIIDHPEAVSHGICPDCLPIVEEKWFGRIKTQDGEKRA